MDVRVLGYLPGRFYECVYLYQCRHDEDRVLFYFVLLLSGNLFISGLLGLNEIDCTFIYILVDVSGLNAWPSSALFA